MNLDPEKMDEDREKELAEDAALFARIFRRRLSKHKPRGEHGHSRADQRETR